MACTLRYTAAVSLLLLTAPVVLAEEQHFTLNVDRIHNNDHELVVELVGRYYGQGPIVVFLKPTVEIVSAPKPWVRHVGERPKIGIHIGTWISNSTLPGESARFTVDLRDMFTSIPSGPATLRFVSGVRIPIGNDSFKRIDPDKIFASPETTIELNVATEWLWQRSNDVAGEEGGAAATRDQATHPSTVRGERGTLVGDRLDSRPQEVAQEKREDELPQGVGTSRARSEWMLTAVFVAFLFLLAVALWRFDRRQSG